MKNTIKLSLLRKPIQIAFSALVTFLVIQNLITIATLIIIGSAIGIIWGKVFCRWMCPMGFIMELLSGAASKDDKAKSLYMYHKLGCPIAWISGILNKVSLFTVGHRVSKECKECGICDNVCYVSTLNNKYSLYKNDKKNPANSYTCSRCLECVDSCPTGRLAITIRKTID